MGAMCFVSLEKKNEKLKFETENQTIYVHKRFLNLKVCLINFWNFFKQINNCNSFIFINTPKIFYFQILLFTPSDLNFRFHLFFRRARQVKMLFERRC